MSREELIENIAVWNNFKTNSGVFFDERFLAEKLVEVLYDKKLEGDIVEFGCFVGESAKIIQKAIDLCGVDKKLYVYDSFQGLPKPDIEKGDGFDEGTLTVEKEVLIANFERNELRVPIIYEGWFNEVPSSAVPDKICFAFLDGDFYDSIMSSLKLVFEKVVPGGIIALHDYNSPGLGGVKLAVSHFFQGFPPSIESHYDRDYAHDIAFIRK